MKYGEMGEIARPKAQVVVMISENGEVVSTQWEKRSGDNSFDASCIRATGASALSVRDTGLSALNGRPTTKGSWSNSIRGASKTVKRRS